MTLAQLRTFLAVAETGSVSAAAARLVVTQSAVSASIAALQRSLDLQLVEPSGRGLRLTPAGAIYAGYLRRVLGLLDEARVAAGSEGEPARGELRIAAVTTVGDHLLPRILVRFREAHPEARIHVEVGNRAQVLALLDDHEVDLVLGGRPVRSRNHVALAVRPNELIVVGPPGSPRHTGDELAELAGRSNLGAARARLGHPGHHRVLPDRPRPHTRTTHAVVQRRGLRVGGRRARRHPDLARRGGPRPGRGAAGRARRAGRPPGTRLVPAGPPERAACHRAPARRPAARQRRVRAPAGSSPARPTAAEAVRDN